MNFGSGLDLAGLDDLRGGDGNGDDGEDLGSEHLDDGIGSVIELIRMVEEDL